MPIKFIFFDQGEVLFTNDWDFYNTEKDRKFYSYYGISKDQFFISRKKFIDLLFRGKITEKDYWNKVLVDVGASKTSSDKAINLARKYQTYKPGMENLIEKLKKNNIPMGIISTTHREIWNYKLKKFNVIRYFNPIITSFETGFVKPEKEIYKIALKRAGVKPNECLFIDDSQNNVVGAKELGMKAILFESSKKLADDLKSFQIL